MSDQYILGIDVGTTGAKTTIFDDHGKIQSRGYFEYSFHMPRSDWAEQDPKTFWNGVVQSIKSCLSSRIKADHILAVGLSGQLNGSIFLDSSGSCLYPCILWLDRRTTSQVEEVKEVIGEREFHNRTGVLFDPFYSIFTFLWFKENCPSSFKKTHVILQPKDYIGYMLTGKYFLDVALASSTGILDIVKKQYAHDFLEDLSIPVEKFPKLVTPLQIVGEITEKASRTLGLRKGIPVVAGSGDVMMNSVGTGVIEEGLSYIKIATASDLVVCIEKPSIDPKFRLATYLNVMKDRWILVGGSGNGGLCYEWFKRNFGEKEGGKSVKNDETLYSSLNREAEEAGVGSEGLIFLPYLIGERSPIWDPDARGVYFGIGLNHKRGHFIRSLLEGTAFSLRHRLKIIEQEFNTPIRDARIVGGGSRSQLWKKIIADVIGKPITSLNVSDVECLGASIVASVGVGIYRNIGEAIKEMVHFYDKTSPDRSHSDKYNQLFKLYLELYVHLRGSFKKLSEIRNSN